MSTGAVIGFAMGCFEKGLIREKETDGLELGFGNHKAMVKMIREIAYREGFGKILADGVREVSQQIAKGIDL